MTVIFATGFEGQLAAVDNVTLTGTASYSSVQERTGAVSLRCNPASGASGRFTVGQGGGSYIHFGLYIASLPSVDRIIFGTTGAGLVNIRLTSAGALAYYTNTTLIGTTAAISTGAWYWVGVRILNATSNPIIQVDGADALTGTTTSQSGFGASFGCSGTEASAIDIYIDDIVSDNTGFLAPSKVDFALPINDNGAHTGWGTGGGGSTFLWGGISNTPPAGVASANELNSSNIEALASVGGFYIADLETYTTLGVGASDPVIALQCVIRHGEDIATGTKTATLGDITNPAIGQSQGFTFGNDAGAHGAEPGLWATFFGPWQTNAAGIGSITRGSSPTMRVDRPNEARVGCIDFMAMLVIWTPAPPAQTITLGLLDASPALYAPTLVGVSGTKLYVRLLNSDFGTGTNDTNLRGTAVGWICRVLDTVPGSSATSSSGNTVAGPTAGVEVGGTSLVWYSAPIAAAATISGAITWNIWAAETNASANVAINGRLEVVDGANGTITLIDQTARTTEVALTTRAAENFAETPAAGVAVKKGDRLRLRIFGADAGTMGTGFSFSVGYDGPTAGADGDTWVQLAESLTFIPTATPAGTVIYPTDVASDVTGILTEVEAWTSRGSASQNATVSTVTGFTTPLMVQSAGTALDWFTKPLAAFTLGGAVRVNARASVSVASTNVNVRCQISRVDADGSNIVNWGTATTAFPSAVNITTTDSAYIFLVSGSDLAVSNGQRLRIRFLFDDAPDQPMVTGRTATLSYSGPTASAAGDTFLTFTQTLSPSTQALTVGFLDSGSALYAPVAYLDQFLTLGLIDAGPALYAPTAYLDQFVTLGLLDAAPALYAPTVIQPSQNLTVPLLDAAPALYAPVAFLDQFVTVPLLDAGSALYAPTATPVDITWGAWSTTYSNTAGVSAQSITVPLLDAGPVVYAPSLAAKNTFTIPLLDAAPALYAPSLLPINTLTVPVLDAVAAVYAPTLVAKNTLTVPQLDAVSALYAPTLLPKYALTVPLLDAVPALYAPTVIIDQFVTVPLLDSGAALYAPSIIQEIDLTLLDAVAALFAPAIQPDQFLVTPLIDSGFALYPTTLSPGPVLVSLPLTDAVAALYAPAVLQAQFITVPLLDAGPALYSPTLTVGPVTLTIPQLDAVAALYAPTLTPVAGATQTITLGLLDGAAALYAPTVLPGAVSITIPLLDAGAALYPPLLYLDQFVTLGLLDGVAAVYAPSLLAKNTLTVGLIDGAATLFAPAIQPDQFLTFPLLDGAAATYAPTLVAKSSVALGLLDASATLFAPAVQPAQFVTLGLLDGAATVYAPTLTVGAVGLTIPQLDGAPALYAPALSTTVTLSLLDGAATLYSPTLLAKSTLTVPLLDAAPALYAPTLGFTVTLGLLDAGSALYAPVVIIDQFVTVPLLDAGAVLYAPTLTVGAVAISLSLLDGAAAVYSPTLIPGAVGLTVPLLDAVAALYTPTILLTGVGGGNLALNAVIRKAQASSFLVDAVVIAKVISLPTVDAFGVLFAPTVSQTRTGSFTLNAIVAKTQTGSFTLNAVVRKTTSATFTADAVVVARGQITLGLLDGGAALYAPTLAQDQFLTVPLLDGLATLYSPTLVGKNSLTIGLIDGLAAVYAPTLSQTLTISLLDGGATTYAPTLLRISAGTGSVNLDAVIKRAVSATFTANAVTKITTAGSFTASAVIKRTATGAFLADAVLKKNLTGQFFLDALLRRTTASSLLASALISRPAASSFSIDSIIRAAAARTFTSDAVVRKSSSFTFIAAALLNGSKPGSFTTNATVKATRVGGFTANAWIPGAGAGAFTLNAVVRRSASATIALDALKLRTSVASFTAAAQLKTVTQASFTASAVVRSTRTGGFATNAVFLTPRASSFLVAAWVGLPAQAHQLSVDAVIKASFSAGFALDAVFNRSRSGTFTAGAWLYRVWTKSFTVDALVRVAGYTFTVDASISGPGYGFFTLDASISRHIVQEIAATAAAKTIAATASATALEATVSATTISATTSAATIGATTSLGSIAATVYTSWHPTQANAFALDAEIA